MDIKTIWLWRNTAKVAALWALATGLLTVALIAFDASTTVALIGGGIVGNVSVAVGIMIWPCWDFTIAPSNNQIQRAP